tara:strand:+ start:1718 stop:2287 length:570 start_codon:yes stop_codon:yes gene_type:complete
MPDSTSYAGQLLIAMPALNDPEFSHSVTLICEHNRDLGAMGIIINHPISMTVEDLITSANIPAPDYYKNDTLIHAGGPVSTDQGFILHDSPAQRWPSTIPITDTLALTSSNDILTDIASGHGPTNSLVVIGYAGWSPGQLEAEIADNFWLTVAATHTLIFDTPAKNQWLLAGELLGIDLNLLNSDVGHA